MIQKYLSLVKFAHTVYAMPFAIVSVFLAYQSHYSVTGLLVLKVIGCMVFARNAAMGFNRWLDRDIDKINVRTQNREIPAGIISPRNALLFVILNSIGFVLLTAWINPLVCWLSPVALLVILGYSYTKRFTSLCHLVLGLGLSLAPVGAWLAVTESFAWPPVCLGFLVLTWVSGFDIIYSLQDATFDRAQKLNSIPVWLGISRSITFARILHLLSAMSLGLFGILTDGGLGYWVGGGIFLMLLAYQHTLFSTQDYSKINIAFMTTNGVASVGFALGYFLNAV